MGSKLICLGEMGMNISLYKEQRELFFGGGDCFQTEKKAKNLTLQPILSLACSFFYSTFSIDSPNIKMFSKIHKTHYDIF